MRPMIETPIDDNPGFVASEPEHCSACFRLICPGQTYYLTVEGTVLCVDCALVEAMIRVRDDMAVEIKRDRLLIKRGKAEVEVFPGEIRYLVNALAEPTAFGLSEAGFMGKGGDQCLMVKSWL